MRTEVGIEWFRDAFVAVASAALVTAALSASATAETLIVEGSTTFNARFMVPYRSAIEAAAKQTLTIVPNKSSLGLTSLLEGHADLAMISTSLESEIVLLRKKTPGLPFERLRSFNI
jgi:ABC-type phosphate transport system substrate-binding protein